MKRLFLVLVFSLFFIGSPAFAQSGAIGDIVIARKIPDLTKDMEEQQAELEKLKNLYIYLALIDQLQSDDRGTILVCRKGLRQLPNEPSLQVLLAVSLNHLGKYRAAETMFKEVTASKDWGSVPLYLQKDALSTYQKQLTMQRKTHEASKIQEQLDKVNTLLQLQKEAR